MAALEQVNQLRAQGFDDNQIADNLQQQGVSPQEITDAINQANIKSAVAGEPGMPPEAAPNPGNPETAGQGGYSPSTQEMGAQEQAQGGEYYDQGYADQGYSQGQGYASSDSGTMVEIAEQVFQDKSKKMQDQVDELNEFKTITKTKVDSVDERLKKIEKLIDALQIKILEKVSSFGRDIDATKKEVAMVEESVGKLTKGLAAKKAAKSPVSKTTKKPVSKKK